MVIENTGIAINHTVKGEELSPVNSIQIVKKIKQTLINTFAMVFKFIFILNKKHVPIIVIKLNMEPIAK